MSVPKISIEESPRSTMIRYCSPKVSAEMVSEAADQRQREDQQVDGQPLADGLADGDRGDGEDLGHGVGASRPESGFHGAAAAAPGRLGASQQARHGVEQAARDLVLERGAVPLGAQPEPERVGAGADLVGAGHPAVAAAEGIWRERRQQPGLHQLLEVGRARARSAPGSRPPAAPAPGRRAPAGQLELLVEPARRWPRPGPCRVSSSSSVMACSGVPRLGGRARRPGG